jgi:chromosome segregation ATPase
VTGLLEPQMLSDRDFQIAELQVEIEDKARKIDELEKQLQSLPKQSSTNESELVKKLKFDTQILMQKLTDYKKAEKNVKELVGDYEQMKLKYFNVLTENSAQKTQIQELMRAKLESEVALKDLNEEKQQYINELYMLRMDITKRIEEVAKKTA